MKNVLIVGFGASSLNIRAVISSIKKPLVDFYFLDTLDPLAVKGLLENIDLANTIIYVISKSGNTHETNLLAQYLIEQNITGFNVLCANKNSELHRIVSNISHNWIDYGDEISGRFALMSKAFLNIAALAGVDIDKILASYNNVDLKKAESIANNWIENFNSGKANWVVMIYSKQIYGLFLWIRQIISESLGKENFGIFPILVEGTMDEHSQLQLFLDGPDDKFYDIISCGYNEKGFEKLSEAQVSHAYKISNMLETKKSSVTHSYHEFIDEVVVGSYIGLYTQIVKIIAEKIGFDPLTQPAVECMKQISHEN